MQKEKKIETNEMLILMRVIEENPQMTQRDLSSKMGLSLGKINYLMKALIDKGFIKAQNFRNARNKTAYLYNLTPSGLEAKARVTYHFLKRKMAEYEKLEKEIQQLKTEVENFDQAATERQWTELERLMVLWKVLLVQSQCQWLKNHSSPLF